MKIKLRCSFIILLGCCVTLNAQLVESWLKSTTSTNINISSQFFGSTYANDHYYLVGEYWRDIAFDDLAFAMSPFDKFHNGFIAKMNTSGETVDLFNISGFDLQRATDIAIGNDGSLWVSGLFKEELTYDFNTVSAQSFVESYLLHLNSEGELIERYHFPAIGMYDGVTLYNIEIDLNGNLWMTFSFTGDFVFDGIEYNGGINSDGLIVQINEEGEVLQQHYFAVSEDTEEPPPLLFLDMAIDTDNNLVVAGTVGGEVTIDGVPMEDVSPSTAYGYVAKFSGDGPLLWTRTYVSNSSRVNSITIDEKDRIYLGFQFADFIIFENETINGTLSFADMAIARISPLGTPQWFELFLHGFNPGTNGGVYAMSLAFLEDQLLVGGLFDDRIIYDDQVIIEGGDRQLGFIINMSEKGELVDSWMLDSPNYARVNTIVASPAGICYGGEYYNSVGLENNVVSSPASALFYGLLAIDQIVSNDELIEVEGVSVFPNPASDKLRLTGLPNEAGDLNIYDSTGRLLQRFTSVSNEIMIQVNTFPTGLYTWTWHNNERRATGVFVKTQ